VILFLQSSNLFSEDKEILEIRKYYQSVQKDLNKFSQAKVDYTHKNSHVDETDLLSEQIYFYSKNKETISKVLDQLNRRGISVTKYNSVFAKTSS
jgi:hypothetical protein